MEVNRTPEGTTQPGRINETTQNLFDFLNKRGFFNDASPNNPLSFEDAQIFLNGLSPAERQELEELQIADS